MKSKNHPLTLLLGILFVTPIGASTVVTTTDIASRATINVLKNDTINHCEKNTSSSYKTITDNYYISSDDTLHVTTSRYSAWTGNVSGSGTLYIHSGGERSYLGSIDSKGSKYPSWSSFKGTTHILPYKEVEGNCGFYGIIMHSGTFQPDNISASNCNTLFFKKSMHIHSGATLAVESGTRGIRIGELCTDQGSTLSGYYKKSSAASYYIVGGSNTSSYLSGDIRPIASGNKVGIIKEGSGCYIIDSNNNDINGSIRLTAGRIDFNNNRRQAQEEGLSGPTGSNGTLFVFSKGTIGGTGHISATTQLYGKISATDSLGVLYFANYASETTPTLTLHPASTIECIIGSSNNYSSLFVDGTLTYSNQKEDFDTSSSMPNLTISVADTATLAINDEFTLLTTRNVDEADSWNFHIIYPKSYSWVVEKRGNEDGTTVWVARVISLDYNGQGDVDMEDNNQQNEKSYPIEDWSYDRTDPTPLRTYAQQLGKNIGVAAASYRYDSRTSSEVKLVGKEFNIIVAENEMKFDATQPSRDNFNYEGANAIREIAGTNRQILRGHTLAWHSQVASWVSQDGKKNNNNFSREELLSILKNHIFNVVGHYRGIINEWDVCNEVLDDDQSIVRTDPSAYKLRPSIWATYIGEDFIDSAFVWAHQADPNAKLYINDYGVEFAGSTKTEAYFNLISSLQKRGIPIDGCGLQCHITTGQLDTLKLEKNIQRYATLGLNCIITELDIALSENKETFIERQAQEYAAITRIFLRNENCPSLLVWGISDNHSWRQNAPLLYDAALQPKPAYYGIHAQLRRAVDIKTSTSEVESLEPLRTSYFTPYGTPIAKPEDSGHSVIIRVDHYIDGTIKSSKQYVK